MSPIPASNADLRIGTHYQSDGDVVVRGDFSAGGAVAGLSGEVFTRRATFQAAGAATHTATIPIPAGATIIDIQVQGIALWTAGTSAAMTVGNDADPDFWYTSTDLKATDLLAGETNSFEHPGGKAGVGIGSEQRVFKVAAANNVIGVVVQVGTSNTGTTDLVVIYSVPASITPVIS